jgi:hypothetical protein
VFIIKNIKSIYWRCLHLKSKYQRQWLRFKASYQYSSPKKAAGIIKKKGVSINDLSSDDLCFVYEKLNSWEDAPTLRGKKTIEKALSNIKFSNVVDDEYVGVIIETREHSALEFVVCNFVKSTGGRVQLFHGLSNTSFILNSGIGKLVSEKKVFLVRLDIDELNADFYNSLLLNEKFWSLLIGRKKIIVFQTDSLICSDSDYNLQDFYDFDYIGAWWHYRLLPNGLILDGGVGGFSLRDYNKSLDCVERFGHVNWQGGEDDFFAFHIDLLGGKVGNKKDCESFCTQNKFVKKSYAAHQLNNLSIEDQKQFLSYCPESSIIID